MTTPLVDLQQDRAFPEDPKGKSYEVLHQEFEELFSKIAAGALEREINRELPYEPVQWLRDAGFGAIRVPSSDGGSGATARTLFRLIVDLAVADPHVAHLWRGHFAFLESRVTSPEDSHRDFWIEEVVTNKRIIGNAQSEQGIEAWDKQTTELSINDQGQYLLSGKKFYSTGTLFADWVVVTARFGDAFANFPVRTDSPGLVRIDDWDGFGQRLTGTGTTTFESVVVDPDHVTVFGAIQRPVSHMIGFYQLHLLSVLAGIGRRAIDDVVTHIRASKRQPLGAGPGVTASEDPLNQAVIGRASAKVKAAQASVLDAAVDLEAASRVRSADADSDSIVHSANLSVYQSQIVVIPLILEATTSIFDACGASSTSITKALDRHWRNARTISSHNPLPRKEQWVGNFELLGELPYPWRKTPENNTEE